MSMQSFALSEATSHGDMPGTGATTGTYRGVTVNIRKVDKDQISLNRDNLLELKVVQFSRISNL